ncbi:MAG: autotransporter-associated beta strand repeat-containing protein [Burkholderiales bacterium]|nr:autotransporter-associated beta strand repeat-containing protein [Burkholderiales bacterium]
MRFVVTLTILVISLLLAAANPSSAATKTWTGGGGNANWSTAANWSPPGAPVAGDLVQFNTPATSNANLGAVAIIGIILGPNSGGTVINGAVTINASILTINIDDQSTSATASQINATVAITGAGLYIKSGNAAHTLSMGAAISGAHAVRIIGPGAVEFASASNNTYTGATTVASAGSNGGAGVLRLSGFATQLVPGDLLIGEGVGAANSAKVQLVATFPQLIKDTSIVNVASDGVLEMGQLSETIARLTGTGAVTSTDANALLIVGDSGDFTWGGVISGPGRINKVGTGTMTYTAVNTYTGTTTVSGGTLVLGAPSRTIFGPLNIGLGVGTTTTATVRLANFYQNDNSFLPITINADGKLDIDAFLDDLGAVTMNGGHFTNADGARIDGGLTMNGGTITAATSDPLTMGSNVVATSTGPFGAASINANVLLRNRPTTFTVNSGSAQPELTINGMLTIGAGLPSSLIKTGAGTLRLAGTAANDYGGRTTIAQGTLELAKPDNVGAITGPIEIGNDTDPAGSATLKNMASNQLIGKPDVTIYASGVYQVADASTPRTETIGKLNGSGKLFLPFRPELTIDFPAGASTFSGVIDHPAPNASGNKRINKRGGGEQIFALNTSYDGLLVVYEGALWVDGQMAQAPVSIQGGTLSGKGRVGDVEVGSNVAAMSTLWPGGAFGPLTTGAAAFSFGPSARLRIDLPSATPGTHGRLSVTGAFRPGDNGGGSLYVNPIDNPTPANGTVFEIVSKVSAGAVTGTFPGLPEGRSVYMGARNGKISYVGGDGNDVTLTVAPTLDIDGDSRYLPETDGLLITRYINGVRGPALIANAVAAGARRTTDADISDYLATNLSQFNVDQQAGADSFDALLITRWLFGFRGAPLVANVPRPANVTAEQFADSVRNLMEQIAPGL